MKRRATGFTLLEVLVAVAIFAILSSLSYAGLTRMLEGRERLEAERDRWRTLSLTFAQMEDDLGQALNRPVRDSYGTAMPPFRGQPVDPRPLGDPSIEFTRGGVFLASGGSTSDLRRVAFRLKEKTLIRMVWPALDRPPTIEPRETVLLTNIDNLTVRFHSNTGTWSDRWPMPNDEKNLMPDAVEVAFDVAGVGRLTRVFPVGQ